MARPSNAELQQRREFNVNSPKQLSRRMMVIVSRDQLLKTPVVIWQHEFPILEEIFGEGMVVAADTSLLDEGYSTKISPANMIHNKTQDVIDRPSESQGIGYVFTGDPGVEYQRLADVYGRHREENILLVEKIYGRHQNGQLKRLMGEPELSDLPVKQLRGMILDYGYAPEPHKDDPQPERIAALALRKELMTMPIDGLVKIAQELEIELG